MNVNNATEYELFTREIYQQLVDADTIKATKVQHNVKLEGKSGQKHQIDVYWEYEIAGVTHKVAIECKNYNKPIAIGKVRDFYGVLADLNNVAGIMVTKAGFQKGTIQFAREHGISLKELRNPTREECIIGEVITTTSANIRHTLFLVDEEWATKNGYDFQAYRRRLNMFRGEDQIKFISHIPIGGKDKNIYDASNKVITSLYELEKKIPADHNMVDEIVFTFEDAYVNAPWGTTKIKEVQYSYEYRTQTSMIRLDVSDFVTAILKDALNGEIKLINKLNHRPLV